MGSQYFTDEELEYYYSENRIHNKEMKETDDGDIYYTAILTTPDGRHYLVHYSEWCGDSFFSGQECAEVFPVPKLALEMGYSSTPESETRISDDIMKADRGELLDMLENTTEELLARDWGQ